jgi:hypothetical protein
VFRRSTTFLTSDSTTPRFAFAFYLGVYWNVDYGFFECDHCRIELGMVMVSRKWVSATSSGRYCYDLYDGCLGFIVRIPRLFFGIVLNCFGCF